MSVERNKAVVRAFAGAINEKDLDRLDGLVAADFIRHSSCAPAVNDREQFKQFLRREFEAFPDARETVEDILAEGEKVAVRHRFRGTQRGPMGPYPPSNKVMNCEYMAIYRIADGIIVESWAEWDNLNGLAQLGHYPTKANS